MVRVEKKCVCVCVCVCTFISGLVAMSGGALGGGVLYSLDNFVAG